MVMDEPRLDYARLKNSLVPTWIGLVAGSWVGLIWGSLITAPVGLGFGVLAGSAFGGALAVPLWGTVFSLVGLGRQRERAVGHDGIQKVGDDDALARRTYALCGRLGLAHRPWVAVMPHGNAFAIGASDHNAMVVIGQPLVETLTADEVDAIIGHELGHIANNDMRRMGFARSFQNALVWYLGFSETLQAWARGVLTWGSELMILGLSRNREYWADAIGASLTSKEHMIAALEKLHQAPPLSDYELRHARLMVRGRASGLLSTHPTLEQRREALQAERYIRRLPHRAATTPRPQQMDTPPPLGTITFARSADATNEDPA
jgi:heat shock protein HtpX